jgi:hypothetical protein
MRMKSGQSGFWIILFLLPLIFFVFLSWSPLSVTAHRSFSLLAIAYAPINFYGKVVDEGGKPVEGATTSYSVGSFSFAGSPRLEGPKTDADGLFSITGKRGPTLSVRVQHGKYHATETADKSFEYAPRNYMPGREPPAPPRDRKNPAIFVLKKKGVAEPLLHHPKLRTRLPMDGKPVTLDARSGNIVSAGSETITFSMKSDGDKLPLNEFYPFDWSVTIEVPGGGMVERAGALEFLAPAEGYIPRHAIDMPATSTGSAWKSQVERDYFVRFGSGKYGRITLQLSGEKGRCLAEIFLNPSGSRNLEFDSAQESAADPPRPHGVPVSR